MIFIALERYFEKKKKRYGNVAFSRRAALVEGEMRARQVFPLWKGLLNSHDAEDTRNGPLYLAQGGKYSNLSDYSLVS